ncbi:hypothetical protein FRC17_008781 [Serendipita sp. 399]|nr:hypothetical protein FRC17_008781 [Serendipita sp. 399]
MWHETGHRAEVSCIVQSPTTKDVFAVGYVDGSIRLWNSQHNSSSVVFNGHKKAVTAMCFDPSGTRLASGSQDTEIILWDVVAETGLFRLRGHRDQITAMKFVKAKPVEGTSTSSSDAFDPSLLFLVTCSKDTFVKLWDMSTRHCVQSIVAHRSEVWTLDIDPTGDILLTGGGEGEVKAWKIDHDALCSGVEETAPGQLTKMLHLSAVLPIASKHRVAQIAYHPTSPFLAIQSHDKSVDVFRIRTEEEIRKKQARREKRAKEKKKTQKSTIGDDEEMDTGVKEKETEEKDIQLVDLYTPYLIVRASGKIRSFNFVEADLSGKGVQIFTALSTNAVEVYTIPNPSKTKDVPEATRMYTLDLPGHRTDIRSVSISYDEQLLATASNGLLKIWNMKSMMCIRDRHVVVGTKSGEILLLDIAAASLLESVKAHSSTVWSMDVRPDMGGLVSGSADKDVKFWDIEEKVNEEIMSDEVLAVKYSPNGRFLAVALLDATVKIFYQDTLKFFLSLYGHKLPVLSMDISSDSKLIITSSSDKNVKIWGMDFGDCHKSIFAHDDSVMQVAFIPRTHHFFSVSKDRWVKLWDADKFDLIQKFDGHHGEIWALTVGRSGTMAVTGSHDKSIRYWENTGEAMIPWEEKEIYRQKEEDAQLAEELNREDRPIGSGVEGADVSDPTEGRMEATAVQKYTAESLMASEKIVEAIELADKELESVRQYYAALEKIPEDQRNHVGLPPRNPTLTALDLTPEAYVLQTVEKVQSAALYDALLALPFSQVMRIFFYMDIWASKGTATTLTSNMLSYLLRIHSSQIVATRSLKPLLLSLRGHLRLALSRQKAQIGYNLAALKYLKRQEEDARTAEFHERGERQQWTEDEVRSMREKIQNGDVDFELWALMLSFQANAAPRLNKVGIDGDHQNSKEMKSATIITPIGV